MNQELNILGFKINIEPIDQLIKQALDRETEESCDRPYVINTLNPHSYAEQKKDAKFREALLSSDALIADGSGIVLATKLLYERSIRKVAGFDLFYNTCSILNSRSKRKVFLLGSTNEVLNLMKKNLKNDFPNIEIAFLSPPFKTEFDDVDLKAFRQAINKFQPDVLFVGLTAPKQEKLILDLATNLDVKMASGIGAVFDFYAGKVERPKAIWIALHLEWFRRLLMEPKRLWKRNFISTPIFLLDLLKAKYKVARNGKN